MASVTPKDGDDATTNDPSDEVTAVTPALSPPSHVSPPCLSLPQLLIRRILIGWVLTVKRVRAQQRRRHANKTHNKTCGFEDV